MRHASLVATALAALLGGVLLARPSMAESGEPPDQPPASPETAKPPAGSPTTNDGADRRPPVPTNAAAALARAGAAYEYGDMNQVVEAARLVTEGVVPASPYEQANAFRLLGIGLYLTNRPMGAETAFTELLRRDPKARLDPTTTRPEAVAFFENLRRQQTARQRRVVWNFIPPLGQFQNEDNGKGWAILSIGVASLATAGTTAYLLNRWQRSGDTYSVATGTAKTVRDINWIAVGALAATYIYGVFDGLIGYSRPVGDENLSLNLKVFPEGGVGFAF
jgi:hypothetical protein